METILRKPASRYRVLRLRRRLQVWAMTRSFKAAAANKPFAITQALAKPTCRRCIIRIQENAPYIWYALPSSDSSRHPSCISLQRQVSP